MTQWGLIEITGMETWAKLAQLQWKLYGTKLDEPTFLWNGEAKKSISYPTLDEIEREMKKKPDKMRRGNW